MKTFTSLTLILLTISLFTSPTAFAGSTVSFTKFDQVFGYKSSYSQEKKDKLIKKLNGRIVEWEGKLTGKFFHFSQTSLSLDMGEFAGPRNVNVTLKGSEQEKLRKIKKGSIVKVRARIDGYGKVKFHNLIDGVILKFKETKDSTKDFDARDIRFKHLEKR